MPKSRNRQLVEIGAILFLFAFIAIPLVKILRENNEQSALKVEQTLQSMEDTVRTEIALTRHAPTVDPTLIYVSTEVEIERQTVEAVTQSAIARQTKTPAP